MEYITRKNTTEEYTAFLNGGCLNYEDAKGAYKIIVGKRSWFPLITLEENEHVTRRLDIDLLTGNVYYSLDNHTETGLAYYYDINTTKVWNKRIYRLLLSIRDEALKPSLPLKRAIQKLPCDDWVEVLSILPGFDEAMENRYEHLFLPHRDVETVNIPAPADTTCDLPDEIVLYEHSSISSAADQDYHFQIVSKEGQTVLHYENQFVGAEFFNEDEVFERILTPVEICWVASMAKKAKDTDSDHHKIRARLIQFLRRELEISPAL